MARRFCLIIAILAFGLSLAAVRADTFKLVGGETLVGELLPASANDAGVQVKVGDGDYKRVPWANFSQEDLKRIAKMPKMDVLVEPFIEITQEEKIKKTEVTIKPPTRLELSPSRSLFGAMFSSGLGIFIFLVLYAANIYAGYEVSIIRAQPPALVCGVSAILPIAGPIIFLAMKTKTGQSAAYVEPAPAATPAGETPEAAHQTPTGAPAQTAAAAYHPPAVAHSTETPAGATPGYATPTQPERAALPASTTFKRGQFTFNRRFFETKFPGFLSVVKREADRDMVLVFKSARGEYVGERISQLAANDLHLQVQQGEVSQEVMIPFQDIQEITLKHRDA